MNHAQATFRITSWNEQPIHATAGLPKLAQASVTQSLAGDITGEGTIMYVMSYRDGRGKRRRHPHAAWDPHPALRVRIALGAQPRAVHHLPGLSTREGV